MRKLAANVFLTGDGLVDLADLQHWLADAGSAGNPSRQPFLPGDANLDGVVDGSDFGIWNANKFRQQAAWCQGDFNADGSVDGSDFGIWNANKFTAADGVSAVPEATGLWPLLLPFLFRSVRQARCVRRGGPYEQPFPAVGPAGTV